MMLQTLKAASVPCSYPAEFRREVLDLVEAGRPVRQIAQDLGISEQTIHVRRRQYLIDTGQLPGPTSEDQAELVAARRRIAELEAELAVHRRAAELMDKVVPPKRRFEAVAVMAGEGSGFPTRYGRVPVPPRCAVLPRSAPERSRTAGPRERGGGSPDPPARARCPAAPNRPGCNRLRHRGSGDRARSRSSGGRTGPGPSARTGPLTPQRLFGLFGPRS
ncbi:transposase [Streptomyces sp. NPDC014676]|uniref:transposase n=1 Tax=Streptomyces sp. NPDC014676 TaxID=3364879 RepID=UPI0036FE0BF6